MLDIVKTCVFFVPLQSIFGKGLTTILNEYVATKTKGGVFRWSSTHKVLCFLVECIDCIVFSLSGNRVTSRGSGCDDFVVEKA